MSIHIKDLNVLNYRDNGHLHYIVQYEVSSSKLNMIKNSHNENTEKN